MARVPSIIRNNPVSQVAPQKAQTGQAYHALAELASVGADFVKPAAVKQSREEGEKSVYRDAQGKLQVEERSVLGGEMAAVHNSAAYAKYLGQKQIDISETFNELSMSYEFDPAGFESASNAYIKILQEDEAIPSVLKEELLMSVRNEASNRTNGLYHAEVRRNYDDANTNTRIARDLLVEDFVSLYLNGDVASADDKMAEIMAMSDFRSNAPYIGETPVQTEAYIRGVWGAAKAALLTRELGELGDEISDEKREEILGLLNDPDISVKARQGLYTATKGVLKGIDASAIVRGLTDDSFFAKTSRAQGVDLSSMATGGARRPDSFTGMNVDFRSALQEMIGVAPSGIREGLKITSGFRTLARQKQLWEAALKKYGSPEVARQNVAPPGRSQHNFGSAADLEYASDEVKAWVHDNAGDFGLSFPMSHEPWHVELASARDGTQEAKRAENSAVLLDAGLPINDGTEFMAMNFGADKTVAMLSADPNSTIDEFIPEAVEKNPALAGMTISQLQNWANRKMTMKASDLAAMGVAVSQIEDPELRALASSKLNDEIKIRSILENSTYAAYQERIASSDPSLTQQEIAEDHDLSSQAQKTLTSAIRASQKAQITLQDTVRNLNDPSSEWNMFDPKVRTNVDDVFVAGLDGGSPMSSEGMMASNQIANTTGFIPKTMFNALRSAVLSDDPEKIAGALEYLGSATALQNTAISPYGNRKQLEDALADFKFYGEFGTSIDAAEKIVANRDEVPKNVKDAAKDAVKDLSASDIRDHFDDSWLSNPDMGTPGEQAEMMAEYERLFKDAFVATGDHALAKNRALEELGRIYAPNSVTGSRRVMKFPPQMFYKSMNGTHSWMSSQIEEQVSAFAFGDDASKPSGGLDVVAEMALRISGKGTWIPASKMRMVSDAQTRFEVLTGKDPSYNVWFLKDGNLQQYPERFTFDQSLVNTAEAQMREDLEAKHGDLVEQRTNAESQYYDLVLKHGVEAANEMIGASIDGKPR